MTTSLARVFEAVSRLPEADQDRYAAIFRSELEDDSRWAQIFEDTAESLDVLGQKAIAAHRAGRSTPLDPGSM